MQGVVKELNETFGEQRIYRTEAFATADKLLDDHVHLNEEGYKVWDNPLYPQIQLK